MHRFSILPRRRLGGHDPSESARNPPTCTSARAGSVAWRISFVSPCAAPGLRVDGAGQGSGPNAVPAREHSQKGPGPHIGTSGPVASRGEVIMLPSSDPPSR
jgi:hypothetical protein